MTLRQLPNVITIARILLVAPLVWLLHEADYRSAFWLALVAGASDGIDGFLAKQFDWRTRLGGLLDPIADKLLLNACVMALWSIEALPGWLALLVVGRDLLILGGATAYHFLVKPLNASPSLLSKLTTVVQILLVLAVLTRLAWHWPPMALIQPLLMLAAVLTVASGAHYVIQWSRRARQDWPERPA